MEVVGPIKHIFLCVETDPETGKCKKFVYVGCVQRKDYYYKCAGPDIGKQRWGELNYWKYEFNLIDKPKICLSKLNIGNYSNSHWNKIPKKCDVLQYHEIELTDNKNWNAFIRKKYNNGELLRHL
jgi:hypothetical protein